MKNNLNRVFKWASKHWAILTSIGLAVFTLFFTFVVPILMYRVYIPVFALIGIAIAPLFTYKVYLFCVKPTKFKGGERVTLQGTSNIMYINGYQLFSKTYVNCIDSKGNSFIYHQDALSLYQDQSCDRMIRGSFEPRDRYW